MSIDSLQASFSGIGNTSGMLRENAKDIAQPTVNPLVDQDNVVHKQVQAIAESYSASDRTQHPEDHDSDQAVDVTRIENVARIHILSAQTAALPTAFDVLGEESRIGQNIQVYA